VRPLAALGAETCRRLLGVAFDIDDTVTRDGRLELIAFQAMHALADAGLHLVAVTGRPLGWADVVATHWPLDAAVGENGAGWVWRTGGVLREGYFEPEEERRGYGHLFERVRRRVAAELPDVREAIDQRARRCDLAFDVGEAVMLPQREIDALVAIIEAEGAHSSVSSVHAHVIPGDWNKARGIALAVRDALGVDVEDDPGRWLFIGDSSNDEAAFDFFPLSVGVSNVRDHIERLTARPKFVTTEDRGRGFAEMALHVLRARGRAEP
jgi:HAD superfamily hydrolase (TIGR01484 family)